MEKCVYNGKILYACQVLQSFEFEQKIRSCHALTCFDCGAPVFFKHGKQRAECFAHYKREECQYGEYCRNQSDIFKYAQRELYKPLERIADKNGFILEEDVIIIPNHYTAFVLKNDNIKYAIDIIDTSTTSAILEKRNRLYEESGYHILQITVDKDAESEPFSERDMAYFPVKHALNKSLNNTAIVIDKEHKTWHIYILDKMDMSDLPDDFFDFSDWYLYDALAMQITLDELDIDSKGFYTFKSNTAFNGFYNNRRIQKFHWIKEETDRRERQRIQAEEARRQAEIRKQEYERRLKEVEEKRKQEAEVRKAEVTKVEGIRKQQRVISEKAEILNIHLATGGYVGDKVKGKYEVNSLEALTSKRPSRNWLCEYHNSHFMERIKEIKEFKQSGVSQLFAKMCFINQSELSILYQILSDLKKTDAETASVIEYMIHRAGL